MKKIILATFNPHKTEELKAMLPPLNLIYKSLLDYPGAVTPEETGKTLRENALIKAKAAAKFTNEWAMADDTGLEVMCLDGAPGIFSARYAGEQGNAEENNKLLLANMADIPKGKRGARFVCVIALASPEGETYIEEGILNGSIITEPRGLGGFGYDCLFEPEGEDLTLAQLGKDGKNAMSHRYCALQKIIPVLRKIAE